MEIISHRGYWKETDEKNKKIAFERSFKLNFGTETDIRDYKGSLVISHDIAGENAISIDKFLSIYTKYNKNLTLALNIKADGLQEKLNKKLTEYDIKNYFVFDMAVPDGLLYLNSFKTFTRQSEYEETPPFYEKAYGVWIDAFISDEWITEELLSKHLQNNKKICIVSPDLHKRNYEKFWKRLKSMDVMKSKNIILCTDYPENARRFFNE